MKKVILFLYFLGLSTLGFANGVGVIDAESGIYLRMLSSNVSVSVENQVAVVTATQVFRNEQDTTVSFKYAFPLREQSSATGLFWQIEGQWYEANMTATPQDTTLPGGGGGDEINYDLRQHLGGTPLYFEIEQSLKPDSQVTVQLEYVELLPYNLGKVNFYYPNDYSLIQEIPINEQSLNFSLASERTISNISLLSHTASSSSNTGNTATIEYQAFELQPNADYHIQYALSLEELGLFSLSTFLPDSLVPDEHGRGYFVFVAEPDPDVDGDVIDKVFTLIIDRSGSMSGDKIVQARNAATFITERLNAGDEFNIISFATEVTSFRPDHVPYTTENMNNALDYISAIQATGGTNISGALEEAISQFATANDSTANIIIFFTDGEATAGITDTEGILAHVDTAVTKNETDVTIFTFGIGQYPNEQLLTLLASRYGGIAEFLGSDELEDRITEFYLQIQNPVLLETEMNFSLGIIDETYPNPLPNLYKGQQLVVAGRYQEQAPVDVSLSGLAFGQNVDYQYQLSLSDSNATQYQFLTKIWAKKKIENLLVRYYILDPESQEASDLKDQIIEISLTYGVLTPFTSFSGGEPSDPPGGTSVDEGKDMAGTPTDFELLGNYPNPFNASTVIKFRVNTALHRTVTIRIYNMLGQIVKTLTLEVNGAGVYQVRWDGILPDGSKATSGMYVYLIDFGNGILAEKMTLVK